jgi:peptidoglycan/LPS O-acetylase OafA/YrhL
MSFGLYVLHFPIIFALRDAGLAEVGFLPFAAAVLLLTFGLAAVSWRFLEQPALELKRYFMYGEVRSGQRGILFSS